MKIYIASSWKNQHGVEMLTVLLRQKGHEVISWIENCYGENHNHVTKKFPFEDLGLMRKMVSKWYGRYTEILDAVGKIHPGYGYKSYK